MTKLLGKVNGVVASLLLIANFADASIARVADSAEEVAREVGKELPGIVIRALDGVLDIGADRAIDVAADSSPAEYLVTSSAIADGMWKNLGPDDNLFSLIDVPQFEHGQVQAATSRVMDSIDNIGGPRRKRVARVLYDRVVDPRFAELKFTETGLHGHPVLFVERKMGRRWNSGAFASKVARPSIVSNINELVTLLGKDAASFFGFKPVGRRGLFLPSADELTAAIKEFNRGLPEEDQIPVSFFGVDSLDDMNHAEAMDRFLKGEFPLLDFDADLLEDIDDFTVYMHDRAKHATSIVQPNSLLRFDQTRFGASNNFPAWMEQRYPHLFSRYVEESLPSYLEKTSMRVDAKNGNIYVFSPLSRFDMGRFGRFPERIRKLLYLSDYGEHVTRATPRELFLSDWISADGRLVANLARTEPAMLLARGTRRLREALDSNPFIVSPVRNQLDAKLGEAQAVFNDLVDFEAPSHEFAAAAREYAEEIAQQNPNFDKTWSYKGQTGRQAIERAVEDRRKFIKKRAGLLYREKMATR